LPFGVISGAHYTGLNINTAVWCGGNLEFARGIQEIGLDVFLFEKRQRFGLKITSIPLFRILFVSKLGGVWYMSFKYGNGERVQVNNGLWSWMKRDSGYC